MGLDSLGDLWMDVQSIRNLGINLVEHHCSHSLESVTIPTVIAHIMHPLVGWLAGWLGFFVVVLAIVILR